MEKLIFSSLILSALSLVIVGVSRLSGPRMKWALVLFVVATAFSIVLEFELDPIALYGFFLFWLVFALERFFPRNSYEILSSENLKSFALFPVRILFISWAMKLFFIYAGPEFGKGFAFESKFSFWLQLPLFLLLSDFVIYLIHRAQHALDFYWKWHKVHHAPTELSAVSNFRSNVLELAFVQFGSRVLVASALGVSTSVFFTGIIIFMTISGTLNHANLDFPKGRWKWLNYIFVTPNFHALHHSRSNGACNYGESFTIFDQLFGTFKMPQNRIIEFGIDDHQFAKLSLWDQHLHPFRKKS